MKRAWLLAAAGLACHTRATSKPPDRGSAILTSPRGSSSVTRLVVRDAANELPIPIDKVPAPPWRPPATTVAFTQSDGETFYMDRTEVTVKAYRECVDAGACTPPASGEREDPARRDRDDALGITHVCPKERMTWYEPGRDSYPINCVTFSQAWRYCLQHGGRLPKGAEWLDVARGRFEDSKRKYPWGDAIPSCRLAVIADRNGPGCGTGGPMPVGSKPEGASPGGALDLIGNLAEIVVTDEEPSHGIFEDNYFTAYGGSYAKNADAPDSRIYLSLDYARHGPPAPTVGFRCVYYRPGSRDF